MNSQNFLIYMFFRLSMLAELWEAPLSNGWPVGLQIKQLVLEYMGRGHNVAFLGKTLYSYSASLHPNVSVGIGKLWSLLLTECWAITFQWTSIPSKGK